MAVKQLRRLIRQARYEKNNRRLKNLNLNFKAKPLPHSLEIDGTATSDRHAWLEGALAFGRQRFGDSTNSFETQRRRLHELEGYARGLRLDGNNSEALSAFEVVTGRACLKDGTAAGRKGGPPELYKRLPYVLLVDFWKHFSDRLTDVDVADPDGWKDIEFQGIPKTRKPTSFDEFRWIGKLHCCAKWYMHCLRPRIRLNMRPSSVATFGFRAGYSCDDITAIIRQCLFLAWRWGLPIVLATADVRTAS